MGQLVMGGMAGSAPAVISCVSGFSSGHVSVVWLVWSGHNRARSRGLMDSLFTMTGTPWALIDASLALHLYPASLIVFCE